MVMSGQRHLKRCVSCRCESSVRLYANEFQVHYWSNVSFSVAELASAIVYSCKYEAESNFRDRLQRLHMALAILDFWLENLLESI